MVDLLPLAIALFHRMQAPELFPLPEQVRWLVYRDPSRTERVGHSYPPQFLDELIISSGASLNKLPLDLHSDTIFEDSIIVDDQRCRQSDVPICQHLGDQSGITSYITVDPLQIVSLLRNLQQAMKGP